MKKILLDSNFVVSCVKNKIDFFEKLIGNQILIPTQVIEELKKLSDSKQKLHNKEIATLSLQIIQKNKFKKIDLGKGHVDKKIIQYVKDNPEVIVATLDKELQKKINTKKLIIRGKKKLEII